MNQSHFAIEAEQDTQESLHAQRQCIICGDTWAPGPPRAPFRIILRRAEEQIGDLCEACLRKGMHAASERLIGRIQVEKQNVGALDAMIRKIVVVAPAEWKTALKEWARRQNSLLNKS